MNGRKLIKQQRSEPKPVPWKPTVPFQDDAQPNPYPMDNSVSFDQPVILQQSPVWSRGILWALMGVTTAVVLWACFSKIEEAIPAQGKLEPQDAVKEVQSPSGGVVKKVYVKDGDKVLAGDLLISMEPAVPQAQLNSQINIRKSLIQENQFYRYQMAQSPAASAIGAQLQGNKLPDSTVFLTKSRSNLAAQNELYRAELNGNSANLTADQQQRFEFNLAELTSRVAAAQLQLAQLGKQLRQNEVRIAGARELLKVNQGIFNDLKPVAEAGALARVQFLRQQQEVSSKQTEVDQLDQEQYRIQLAIAESKEQLKNTVDVSRKELLAKMAENEQRLAEIDSQLSKGIVENQKRISEIDSQISQARLSLKYQEIKAPANGTIFDLKAGTGFVATTTDPILKIVPDDKLVAKVFITNKDIGFVRQGMDVDVRIDAFPYSEFGDIKGRLIWIGSDALPPDQINPYYRFPAKVSLDRQYLLINGKQVFLQSGMALNGNIKVRKRTVMSIFTDSFTKGVESLKYVR